ncbi:MAG: alpha/beta hydrolase-fold protein [Flavobacteriaceae bacterium]
MTSQFRTTQISNPEFESDHLRFITIKTDHLKGRGDICVFVPPGNELKDIPLVILLHGVYGSSWAWALNGGVHHTALKMIRSAAIAPMAIAMPSDGLWGDGSGYTAHHGLDFERWIVDDVPAAVIEHIEGVTERSPRFIAGLSMGGFGALRLGIKYGKRFMAVSAHSAMTHFDQMKLFVEEPVEELIAHGAMNEGIWDLVQRHRAKLPSLRFDCGKQDPLLEYNRKLHAQLKKAGIPHGYEEFEGGHEWAYWQEHVKDSLRFFDAVLH